MKSVLLIGLGHFGKHIAMKLNDLEHQILAVDLNEERIQEALPYVTEAQIGDSTNKEFLLSLGVRNFDVCIVTIGDNFQNSLETVWLLKELGAEKVIARASREMQEKFLLRNGADEVVYPERDMAEKTAVMHNANNIFDYIELTSEYAIYELPIVEAWIGRTISEIDVRRKYNVNIIAVKNGNDLQATHLADHIFTENDTVAVIGKSEDVFRLAAKT